MRENSECDHGVGVLCDDFIGHSAKQVKAFTTNLGFLSWQIMAGGITPVGQPLDKLVNKVFKGYFRELFDQWSLTAPINAKTGSPKAPSRQLLAQWVVQAWDRVPEALCRKAWVVCGYRPAEDSCSTSGSTAIVNYQYSQDELGKIVEKIIGGDDSSHFYDDANNPDPMFPDDESDSDSDGE